MDFRKIRRKVGQIFFGDLKNKALALVMAVFVWFYVSEEITTVRTIDVPLNFVIPKTKKYKGVKVVWQKVQEVRVVLRGPKAKFPFLLRNLSMRFEVPEGTKIGEKEVMQLTESYLNLPPGMVCKEISPAKIEFILSRRIREKVPVELNFSARDLPPGYSLVERSDKKVVVKGPEYIYIIEDYSPKRVIVKGPEYILSEIESLPTTLIDFKNITKSGEESYSVQIPNKYKDDLVCEQSVSLRFRIEEPLTTERLRVKVRVLLSEEFKYIVDLFTKIVELSFEGPEKELRKLKGNPSRYLDAYIAPEELDSSELKAMDKNQDPPKELPLKVLVSGELRKVRILNRQDLPTVKFYILKKKKEKN